MVHQELDRERSIDRAHAVIRAFVRSASSPAGEDPAGIVELLRHTLPSHFAVEERADGFFDRLHARGVPSVLLDRLRADHREFLDRLVLLEKGLAQGETIAVELGALADRLKEHEWIESATAAQLGEFTPSDPVAEPAPAERAVPPAEARALEDLAERCRALAAERRGELLAGLTVAVPEHLQAEAVRSLLERALSDRGIDFVEVCLCSADEVALRGARFRRVR